MVDCQPWLRFGGALLTSLLGHTVVLLWPLHAPAVSAPGFEGPPAAKLRVSLKPPQSIVVDPIPNESASISPDAAPEAPAPKTESKEVPQTRQRSQGTSTGPEQSAESAALLGYYPVAKLSRMPEAISRFDIQAPAGGDTGLGGKMTIRIWISAKGEIDQLRVLKSELPSDYAEAALAAFGKLRFEAGEINGTRVNSWADIVIEYVDFRRDAAQSTEGSR